MERQRFFRRVVFPIVLVMGTMIVSIINTEKGKGIVEELKREQERLKKSTGYRFVTHG